MKLRSNIEEKSESMTEPAEDELEELSDTLRMSGAVRACTLVVDRNSIGDEITV